MTSPKMPFTDKDGHLTKAFQKEKHDTASQLLTEKANRNWSHR